MAFAEDQSLFMSTVDFAEAAVVALPADVAGVTINGIFDAAYLLQDAGGGGIESTAPAFTVSEASLPAALRDALVAGETVSFELRDETWTVVACQPDGTGLTTLRLRK